VSQQIAALESDLGVALLRRRPVEPTEAGDRLLRHARPVLVRLETARLDLSRLAAGPPARLTLGTSALAFGDRAARALAAARQRFPRADLAVHTTTRGNVVEETASGRFDVGLVDGVAAPTDPLRLSDAGPLVVEEVSQEPLVVVLPAGHPLAHRSRLRLDSLVDARWIDAADAAASLADLGGAAGSAIPTALRLDGCDTRSLLELVAGGHGLAVLPARAVEPGGRGTVLVPLTSPRLVHRVEVVHGSDLQPVGRAFVTALLG
jgi:DNA-binding transcriptional LysR family regulator